MGEKSFRFSSPLVRGIALSLGLHVLVLALSKNPKAPVSQQILIYTTVGQIQKKIIPKALPQRSQNSRSRPLTSSTASLSSSVQKAALFSSYSDLFPKRNEKSFQAPSNNVEPAEYKGDRLSELIQETNELSVNFDLPLVFRRDLTEGSASAQLLSCSYFLTRTWKSKN